MTLGILADMVDRLRLCSGKFRFCKGWKDREIEVAGFLADYRGEGVVIYLKPSSLLTGLNVLYPIFPDSEF